MNSTASSRNRPTGSAAFAPAFAVLSAAAVLGLIAVTVRYRYDDLLLDRLPQLTAAHVADPRFAGTTFRFEGRATQVRTLASGTVTLRLHNSAEDVHLEASAFPSLGRLPLKPRRGETVRVTGNLGTYRGRPQIRPLSARHVEVVLGEAVPLATALSARDGETLLVGPVAALRVEPFAGRGGRRHFELEFADARTRMRGVVFEGDWTADALRRLRSGTPVVVAAERDEYRGEPSLTVRRVEPADRP